MRWFLRVILPPVVVLVGSVILAELIIGLLSIPKFLLPLPSDVWKIIRMEHAELLGSLLTTARAALIGFGASVVVGIVVALLLSTSKLVQRAFYPYTVFFQTVPIVAIAPLLVIWFGAGLKSVATCAFIVSVFPVIANTLSGLLSRSRFSVRTASECRHCSSGADARCFPSSSTEAP